MGREIDLRDWTADRITPARQEELRNLAAEASVRLPGGHELRIAGFDRATGNPSAVASDLAEPERDNHVQRALDHVRSIGRVLGLVATQPTEFAADPSPIRSSPPQTSITRPPTTYFPQVIAAISRHIPAVLASGYASP